MSNQSKKNATLGLATYGLAVYGLYKLIFVDAIFGVAIFGCSQYGKKVVPDFYDPRHKLFSAVAFGKIIHSNPEIEGIYQRQPTEDGQIVRKLKLYEPTNPQTEEQQAWRGTFADAVQAWQNLTEEEKSVYNNRAEGKKLSGYNLFLSQYLYSS